MDNTTERLIARLWWNAVLKFGDYRLNPANSLIGVSFFPSPYMTLDDVLTAVSRPINVLRYVSPINELEARELFRKGEHPGFVYKELEYDPHKAADEIARIHVPDKSILPLADVYTERLEDLMLQNQIIAARGQHEVVRALSQQLYGIVDASLLDTAHQILARVEPCSDELVFSASDVKQQLEQTIAELKLEGFVIEYNDAKRAITVNVSEQKATLPSDRMFSQNEYDRLPVHEIGTHMVRAHNGAQQPYRLFETGFPGYLSTEEGLATFSELISGRLDVTALRKYAGRVLAVESVAKNSSFQDTYELLRDNQFSDDDAWGISTRVHRGGGFLKDHVYLLGLKEVTRYAEQGNNLELLYLGKIGLQHVPAVQELLDTGRINTPEIIPAHIRSYQQEHTLKRLLTN